MQRLNRHHLNNQIIESNKDYNISNIDNSIVKNGSKATCIKLTFENFSIIKQLVDAKLFFSQSETVRTILINYLINFNMIEESYRTGNFYSDTKKSQTITFKAPTHFWNTICLITENTSHLFEYAMDRIINHFNDMISNVENDNFSPRIEISKSVTDQFYVTGGW